MNFLQRSLYSVYSASTHTSVHNQTKCIHSFSLLLQRGSNHATNTRVRRSSHLCLKDQRDKEAMSGTEEPFRLKKAVVLTKFSRLEFEQRTHPSWSEGELIENVGFNGVKNQSLNESVLLQLQRRGSDYSNLKQHHDKHSQSRDHVVQTLNDWGIETKLVNRFDYDADTIDWADAVFTTGGDGTFLMAASKVTDRNKPVIGINSDPNSSIGHLCLPDQYSSNFKLALDKLSSGDFKWKYRSRLRVSLESQDADDEPVELHNQQLLHPEYRFLDLEPRVPGENDGILKKVRAKRVLDVRALNEVFFGESLSSRVSYYELRGDGFSRQKLKSSGLTVCTGTGSTSWSFNINKVTPQCVESLLKIISNDTGVKLPSDRMTAERYAEKFNRNLIFDPEEKKMAYTIRDPVVFKSSFNIPPRGFSNHIEVRSRMFDACIVIDGALSYKFNDGAVANVDTFEEDALKTVSFE